MICVNLARYLDMVHVPARLDQDCDRFAATMVDYPLMVRQALERRGEYVIQLAAS